MSRSKALQFVSLECRLLARRVVVTSTKWRPPRACAGVAVAAVDLSTVDFTALGPGKFETIGNELGAGKSGCQVRARVAGLTYPRCVAPLLAVFEQLASSKAFVGARGVVATHREGAPHIHVPFYRKSQREFPLKGCA